MLINFFNTANSLGSASFTLLDLDVNGTSKDTAGPKTSSPATGQNLPQTPNSSNSTAEILLKPQPSLGELYTPMLIQINM